MNIKLIADAGSTCVEWGAISDGYPDYIQFQTEGVNALLSDIDTLKDRFNEAASHIDAPDAVREVFYYGAGCATPQICNKIKDVLVETFPSAAIFVDSDLLGAARSLFGNKKGIACILGTGSNSCRYDGKNIAEQIPSLGFILGDEGSGAALGKRLLGDAFKKQLPENILQKFSDKYSLELPEILNRTYREQAPNRFLASLTPFIKENLWNPYIYSLVLQELTTFVKRNVAMYKGAHSMEIGFTGSIAHHFEKILREAACSQGYRVSKITQSPLPGLIDYHKNNEA